MADNRLFHEVINNNNNNRNGNMRKPESTGLWVFGYGSLCWQPGFEYKKSVTGYIRGYSRKFWQGNTTHRGTEEKPGRVATLIEDAEAIVWGRAYEVHGDAALPYLNTRECSLGGYMTRLATFHPRRSENEHESFKPFPALLYVATPSNDQWLGDAPLTEIASQVSECSGTSGHNVEYIIRLATFMRDSIPEAIDEHLFTLEHLVRSRIKELNLNLDSLMGEGSSRQRQPIVDNRQAAERVNQAGNPLPRPDTFQYTAHVPEKTLRCLKM